MRLEIKVGVRVGGGKVNGKVSGIYLDSRGRKAFVEKGLKYDELQVSLKTLFVACMLVCGHLATRNRNPTKQGEDRTMIEHRKINGTSVL